MLYLCKFLFLLINIDQETVLNWFGVEQPTNTEILQDLDNEFQTNFIEFEPSTPVSIDTLKIIVNNFWFKVQNGLTIADIENALFFLMFVRFIVLTLRYNLKTSFYITCIGLFAAYLWYQYLVRLVFITYNTLIIQVPFLYNLNPYASDKIKKAFDSYHIKSFKRKLKLGGSMEDFHWYNFGRVIYYTFKKNFVSIDPVTGTKFYIDPISMAVSNLDEPTKLNIVPIYYSFVNRVVPVIIRFFKRNTSELSSIISYTFITRVQKKYCPYFIRWQWTMLLMVTGIEGIFTHSAHRAARYKKLLINSAFRSKDSNNYLRISDPSIALNVYLLKCFIISIILMHVGLVILVLFHCISGQYFYLPLLTENTELHIGPRSKKSVYSGGYTAWQDIEEKEAKFKRFFPKVWYGWFGRGTSNKNFLKTQIVNLFTKFFNIFKKRY